MTYKHVDGDIAIWRDELMLPMIIKSGPRKGEKTFFKKNIPLEKADSYWLYSGDSLYYVKANPYSKRLARANLFNFKPEQIIAMLTDKDITVADCNKISQHETRSINKKVALTSNWSTRYDGHHVLELVMTHAKMSYREMLNIIQNEGGYVDSDGIVHKGTAEDKVYTLN